MSRRNLRRTTLLGVIFALALAGGCGAEQDPGPERSTETGIAIRSFMFDPRTARVNVGATVVWSNEDDIAHTVTSGTAADGGVPGVSEGVPSRPDGLFDEALDGAGDRASFTFDEAGTYEYFCAIHDGMTGIVEVA